MGKQSGMDIPPETVICYGCKPGKRMCSYCFMCKVRECAASKEIPTCAHCEESPAGSCRHARVTEQGARITWSA